MSAPTTSVDRADPPPGGWRRLADPVRATADRYPLGSGLAAALGLYLLTRVAQLATLSWLIPEGGPSVREHLLIWDAGWFITVATEGYPAGYTYDEAGTMLGNGYAFFPLYPALIRAGVVAGLSPQTAALAVAWLAGAAAAAMIFLLGTRLGGDRRVGWALVVLVCAQPMAMVLSMAYSEALFLALAAGALLAAHQRAWPWAGGFGLAAGLTRPAGLAVAVAVTLAVALAWRDARQPERVRAAVAVAAALVAVPGYLLWVAWRVGDLDAWFRIQTAGWGSTFDFGVGTWEFVLSALRGGDGWVHLSAAWLLLAAGVAAVVAAGSRLWPPLAGYGLLSLVLVIGQAGYWHSKPRLLVTVLWILIPPAVAAARARPWVAWPVLGGYAAFGIWYGGYLVAVWPYTM